MKCPVCNSRKGKRFCPAKQRQICAQCCGEKRVIEIRCPPDCAYLTSGQSYQRFKDYVAQIQAIESPLEQQLILETSFRYADFLEELEKSIVEYAADLRSLRDSDVSEALSRVRETYETESKGIIYEHASPNPLVQALVKQLRETIESLRDERKPEEPHLGPSELIDCCRVLQLNVRHYAEGSGQDYLQFIRRSHPEEAGRASEGGGLISI